MFKSICISILLTGTAFYSFCQDLEKLNKKELRVFLNQKIIVIDSLINKIVSKHIQLLEQVNLNTNLKNRVDSLNIILNGEKNQLKKINIINANLNVKMDSLVSLIDMYKNKVNYLNISEKNLERRIDSFNNVINRGSFKSMLEFYKQSHALNADEAPEHRDLTYVYPIGWSSDGAYFAYFTSFASGATSFNFKIDQINQFGLTKNVSLIDCEMDCDIEEFIATNDEKLKQLVETYGISKINEAILKTDTSLYKERGLALSIKKTISGTYKDINLQRNIPKIGNLEISFIKNRKYLNSFYVDLSSYEHSDFQSIGYIESPNKKYLLFFIEHWGGNGFEGYPAVSIELVSFPSY